MDRPSRVSYSYEVIPLNSKGHFLFSIVKSLLRIVGCVISIITKNLLGFSVMFILAECFGIIEEFADKR